MARGEDLFEYEYISDHDIMVGVVLAEKLELGESKIIIKYAKIQLQNYPKFSNYILDLRNLKQLTSHEIGIILSAMKRMSVIDGFLALVMDESFRNRIMFRYPEIFDFYAVFSSIDEAIGFISGQTVS